LIKGYNIFTVYNLYYDVKTTESIKSSLALCFGLVHIGAPYNPGHPIRLFMRLFLHAESDSATYREGAHLATPRTGSK
jgi:hypothetical protein